LFSHKTYLVLLYYLAKQETQKTAHWCTVRATQSNCCSAIDFLTPKPCLQQSLAARIDARLSSVTTAA